MKSPYVDIPVGLDHLNLQQSLREVLCGRPGDPIECVTSRGWICAGFVEKGNASNQARSQKFAMGGCFGGLGAKPPAAGGTGAWERSPQRSKILRFFAK